MVGPCSLMCVSVTIIAGRMRYTLGASYLYTKICEFQDRIRLLVLMNELYLLCFLWLLDLKKSLRKVVWSFGKEFPRVKITYESVIKNSRIVIGPLGTPKISYLRPQSGDCRWRDRICMVGVSRCGSRKISLPIYWAPWACG